MEKADTPTQVTWEEEYNASDWIQHPYDMRGLREMVKNSTILPQCINAYKNNIAGFGIGVRYIDDAEETPEMKAEFDRMEELIELLTVEQDTKEIFEDVIEARETFGVAYLEVVRNFGGEVDQVDFIKDTPTMYMTKPLEPYIETEFYHHGKTLKRKKKFRKYRQELGTKTIYFKEFGDPRIMDKRNGRYIDEDESLEIVHQANEIMEFAIGTKPYGEVRWIGQVLGIDGCRRAEQLNNNYFINGRHTPLMIMIQNGTLTDESFQKLNHYMNDIKGEAGQHAFIVLESESTDARTDFDNTEKPTIEIKDLASILQKDELFQEYQENGRRRVQSAFNLPDLYVAYTTDFNRATAQTAQEVTEKQVFQPERKSLAWAINNRLLNAYQFQYVEAYFLDPDISNPDDMYKVLTVGNNAGGLTPNMAKGIISDALGIPAEDYPVNQEEADWGDLPLSMQKSSSGDADISQLAMSMGQQIAKAEEAHDDSVVAVMKEVRSLLLKMQKGDADVPVLPAAD
ncbi:MAG: phage portal protein [Clostridiales bacterium]|nr:phage portal protein [Clostridiales bacterium]